MVNVICKGQIKQSQIMYIISQSKIIHLSPYVFHNSLFLSFLFSLLPSSVFNISLFSSFFSLSPFFLTLPLSLSYSLSVSLSGRLISVSPSLSLSLPPLSFFLFLSFYPFVILSLSLFPCSFFLSLALSIYISLSFSLSLFLLFSVSLNSLEKFQIINQMF